MARGGVPGPGAAAPAPPKVVTVDKLKDNLYVLKGGGGNTALFLTATGAVVVDSKLPGWGQPLLEAIKGITDKPVTMVINTHAHYDHTNGQVEFPASVEVVAHENTKTYMEQANPVYGLQTGPQPNIFKEHGGRGMAARTFKDTLTIGSGADRIDLHYFGRAHTGGDAYVVFPALGVMHVGDTFPTRDLPIMDLNNGGSGVAFAATLAKAAAVPGVTTVINGHNATTMTPADVKTYSRVHRRVRRRRAGREEGRQDGGRRGGVVGDAGEVHRLRRAAGGPRQGRRAGHLHRDQVGRFAMSRLLVRCWPCCGRSPATAQPARPAPTAREHQGAHRLDGAEVRDEMRRMGDAIGVKCDHCHVQGNFASDEKRAKHTAPAHAAAHAALNTEYFPTHAAGDRRVEARPRHVLHLSSGRGHAEAAGGRRGRAMTPRSWRHAVRAAALRGALAGAAALPVAAQEPEPAKPGIAESPTITVLNGLMVPQFEIEMRHFVQALGMNCGGCHVPRQLRERRQSAQGHRAPDDRDDPQPQPRFFPGFTPAEGETSLGRVTCYTCHQGAAQPKSAPVPPAR